MFGFRKKRVNGADKRGADRKDSLRDHVRVVTETLEEEAEQTITAWRKALKQKDGEGVGSAGAD